MRMKRWKKVMNIVACTYSQNTHGASIFHDFKTRNESRQSFGMGELSNVSTSSGTLTVDSDWEL